MQKEKANGYPEGGAKSKRSLRIKFRKNIKELILGVRKKRNERFIIPEALFILKPEENRTLIREGIKLQIPIIAIIDTDTNPAGIQYPIPGNDDSYESLNVYRQFVLNAIYEGKKRQIAQVVSRDLTN